MTNEFKGTKGKWTIIRSIPQHTNIITDSHRICEVKHYDSQIDERLLEPTSTEGKANAILISKAPEMLEMLEKLVNEIKSEYKSDNELLEEARILIKSATEL